MEEREAIEVALEAYRQPQNFHLSNRKPLPAGMTVLLRLAATAAEDVSRVVTPQTSEALPVRDAAIFYLQHVLAKAEDDYRQLALPPGATLQDLKDHKKLLLKWLHPDRNANSWESNLFKRVVASAERLESAMRSGAHVEPSYSPKRRRHPTREGSWAIAQRRVKEPMGWKRRLFKVAVAAAIVILLVALAQLGLTTLQTGKMNWALSAICEPYTDLLCLEGNVG